MTYTQERIMKILESGPRTESELMKMLGNASREAVRHAVRGLIDSGTLEITRGERANMKRYKLIGWQGINATKDQTAILNRPEWKPCRAMQYAIERMGGLRPKVVLTGKAGPGGLGG